MLIEIDFIFSHVSVGMIPAKEAKFRHKKRVEMSSMERNKYQ